MEIILYIIAAILSLLGMVTLIRAIVYRLFTTGWESRLYQVICLDDNNAEIVLRDAIEQINWYHIRKANDILAVDMGLDPMTRDICKIICRDYGIKLCSIGELNEVLRQQPIKN